MEVNCEPIRIEHAKIHDPWLVHVLQPTTFWKAPEKYGRKTRPCKENRTTLRGGINMAGSGTGGATTGENQWRGCLGDGSWYGHHHHAISWNMLPSIELAPKSPQVHRVRIEIRSRTEATQHSDSRLGNKLSNILWRHPCWLLWNCSRLMEMWHMFECFELHEIGVLLFTCSGTWTLNQHQYIYIYVYIYIFISF